MVASLSRTEKRRHRRWRYDGMTAIVSSPAAFGSYQVQDVSAGGALLSDGPLIPVGDTVEIVLQLGSHVVARLAATITRHQTVGPRGVGLGVAFIHETAETEDTLQDAAVRELERRATPAALIVSQAAGTPDTLAIPIERLGVPVLVAQTPLEAIAIAVDPRTTIGAILVDGVLGTANGVELLHVVAEMFPNIRRVFVCRSGRQLELQLAKTLGVAHATLNMPTTRERLRSALALA